MPEFYYVTDALSITVGADSGNDDITSVSH